MAEEGRCCVFIFMWHSIAIASMQISRDRKYSQQKDETRDGAGHARQVSSGSTVCHLRVSPRSFSTQRVSGHCGDFYAVIQVK
jgi:hypothetical protein